MLRLQTKMTRFSRKNSLALLWLLMSTKTLKPRKLLMVLVKTLPMLLLELCIHKISKSIFMNYSWLLYFTWVITSFQSICWRSSPSFERYCWKFLCQWQVYWISCWTTTFWRSKAIRYINHSVEISGFFSYSDFTWNQFWRIVVFGHSEWQKNSVLSTPLCNNHSVEI